jgi:hypothetical protein
MLVLLVTVDQYTVERNESLTQTGQLQLEQVQLLTKVILHLSK